ncbi:MAG: proton-conducting transporter membrane subunit [Bacteroidota bacterium]|nr:proton-conducting transporter membrane subunit [Bacteroidota bacterium]
MNILNSLLIITGVVAILLPFLNFNAKSVIAVISTVTVSALSSILAVNSLTGADTTIVFNMPFPFGQVPLMIDAISSWFILVINFTFITGIIYGVKYLKHYERHPNNDAVHFISYILLHASMIMSVIIQNSLLFMVVWEFISVFAFLLVIFNGNNETIKAGINYLIQAHIGLIFLVIAFLWIYFFTGSFSFSAIGEFVKTYPWYSIPLFILLFIGFGFKAGFVPFHTWLPHAHPNAPSHISGIMSGVIIKLGIYGILRMLVYFKSDLLLMGQIVLIISLISGLYGVMLAIMQHDLKKLLAYHSIENIGIIGIGIGIGMIGLGLKNEILAMIGFAGALLHVANHSLFKSLLFYGAGSVYQQTHTRNVEQLGGVFKYMPQTGLLFLIASLAICGLPPFNGFISEFVIYEGLIRGLRISGFNFEMVMILGLIGLSLIGGLAIFCFTKAFGISFLGSPRKTFPHKPKEESLMLFPQYLVVILIVAIGFFPQFFLGLLARPVSILVHPVESKVYLSYIDKFSNISYYNILFVGITLSVILVKKLVQKDKVITTGPTWGCGYTVANPKIQYTSTSYSKTYATIAKPILGISKEFEEIKEIFPQKRSFKTHTYDKIETGILDTIIKLSGKILDRFSFFQNGRLQSYIIYGVLFMLFVFIMSVIIN